MIYPYDSYGLYAYYPYSSYSSYGSIYAYNPYASNAYSPLYSLLATSPGPMTLSTGALAAYQQASQVNYFSQEQPLALTNALVTLNGYANNLLQASRQVTSFDQMTAISDSAFVSATALPGATQATYSVGVSQMAKAQLNAGTALNSAAPVGLAAGTYSLTIQSGTNQYPVSFTVNAGDTNQTVINNLAQAINGAGAGVTASVVNDAVNGTSQLVVQAKATGTANAFTLSDTVGTAVAYAGVGAPSTAAADAVYTLNGIGETSSSNTITVDSGLVNLTFSGLGSGATVTVSPDKQALSTAIGGLVSAYNNLVTFSAQNQQYVSPVVSARLAQAYEGSSADLSSIGITVNPDGTLAIDQNKLSGTLSTDYELVRSALGGVNGLATAAQSLATAITSSPLTSFANASGGGGAGYDYFGIYNNLALLNATTSWSMLLPQGRLLNTSW